jgi:hypothetical protein
MRSRGCTGSIIYRWPHSERYAVPALLDEVDNVAVVEAVDIDVVHGEDTVTNLESATSLGRRSWNDASDGRTRTGNTGDYHKTKSLGL